MNYYLNEYSLRGQFNDVDSFFASLRDETLPALKAIEERNEGIIWKRAKEFAYHPPHFHVSYRDYAAVFRLEDGAFYKEGKNKMSMQMTKEIQQWYQLHKAELQEAWNRLHG